MAATAPTEPGEALIAWLEALSDEFAASLGRRPTLDDMRAVPGWYEASDRQRRSEAEAALAAGPAPGQCVHFVRRQRRYCSARAADAADAHGLCSEHAALARSGGQSGAMAGTVDACSFEVCKKPGDGASVKRNLGRRMRKCFNPMSQSAPPAAPPADWASVYADTSLPLLLDIGCAKGRFLQLLATRGSVRAAFERARGIAAHNLLGVEIFAPLADAANAWRDARAPAEAERNVHFIGGRCDGPALRALRPPGLRVVCIQFPDPWVLKHARRRVVNADLADALAELLPVGGEVYGCSDVRDLALDMRATLLRAQGGCAFALHAKHDEVDGAAWRETAADAAAAEAGFARNEPWHVAALAAERKAVAASAAEPRPEPPAAASSGGGAAEELTWIKANPFGAPTERDLVCEGKWRRVWRFQLTRL